MSRSGRSVSPGYAGMQLARWFATRRTSRVSSSSPVELEYDATLRNLEILGAAAAKVPDELKHQYASVEWRGIERAPDVLASCLFGAR
jgi:uncharacterized protein with HEPN domain